METPKSLIPAIDAVLKWVAAHGRPLTPEHREYDVQAMREAAELQPLHNDLDELLKQMQHHGFVDLGPDDAPDDTITLTEKGVRRIEAMFPPPK